MKYLGNKTRLLEFIFESAIDAGVPVRGTLIDIFGGTGSVGRFFKEKGMRIISNDIMTYSYVAQYTIVTTNIMPKFTKISSNGIEGVLEILNNPNLQKEGYVYENFAPSGKAGRQYFSDENARRIDAIRDTIADWKKDGKLSEEEFNVLVYSFLDAADFVANIAGTYGAYLKIWRSMALKPITLKVPLLYNNNQDNLVYQQDANKLIRQIEGDILYIDPPYNERQYAPNFHMLETLVVWDKQVLTGKSGQRDYTNQKSDYCTRRKATKALEDLIRNANVKYIILSYNNEGIIPRESILSILQSKGQVQEFTQQYRRFRTERDNEHRHYKECDDKVAEHLYIVKVVQNNLFS
jgi:adenine-specific DNA-methyltransferase